MGQSQPLHNLFALDAKYMFGFDIELGVATVSRCTLRLGLTRWQPPSTGSIHGNNLTQSEHALRLFRSHLLSFGL